MPLGHPAAFAAIVVQALAPFLIAARSAGACAVSEDL
jgi:hypothetical protein